MRMTPQKDEQVLASIRGKVGIPYSVSWNQSNPLGKVSPKAVSLWLSGFPSRQVLEKKEHISVQVWKEPKSANRKVRNIYIVEYYSSIKKKYIFVI